MSQRCSRLDLLFEAWPRRWVRFAALACSALLCAGCGSSGPVQPEPLEVEDPLAAIISPVAQMDYDAALAAMAADDPVEAELRLEQFVLEYPQFPGAFVNLAILYERDDRTDESLAALEQALAIDSEHAAANHHLGIVLRKLGRFEEAEQAYSRALAREPNYALAHRNLGILLDLYLHRPAEALQHYRRFQELAAEPDAVVGRWIIDLERRVGADADADAARLVQGDST